MTYSFVRSPSTFPPDRRRILLHPVTDVTHKNKEKAYPELANALSIIARRYATQRILVHTVSYHLASTLQTSLLAGGFGNRVVTYDDSRTSQSALKRYRATPGAILLASSFDRGIDLPGDDCRAIVVCKVPFPGLGDKQVSARLHGKGGQLWYTVQAVRSLVQMTGRGMRSADDWCDSFILDRVFISNIWRKHKSLLPGWWTEALVWDAGVLK